MLRKADIKIRNDNSKLNIKKFKTPKFLKFFFNFFSSNSLKKILAFSVIEIIISLISIGVFTISLAPVITKKFNRNIQGNQVFTQNCSYNYSSDCKYCTSNSCVICMIKSCPSDSGYNSKKCKCCPVNCASCLDDLSTCTSCIGGYALSNGNCNTACPAGHYCPYGKNQQIACPRGAYCPQGSAKPVTCPSGSYCPNEGMSAPIPCEAGYECPGEGRKEHKGCKIGYYQDVTGQAECKPCPSTCPDECDLVTGSCNACNVPECISYGNNCTCTACNPGYNLVAGACQPCNKVNCTAYSAGCTCSACTPGYDVSGGNCVSCNDPQCTAYSTGCECSNCNPGFSGSPCTPCNKANCTNYSSGCTCDTCETGYKVSGGSCVSCGIEHCTNYSSGCTCNACEAGFQVSGGICVPCNKANCTNYSSGCTCNACEAGFQVSGGSCVSCGIAHCTGYSSGCTCNACENAYQPSGGSCEACSVSNCATYSPSTCTCTACASGNYLYNNTCGTDRCRHVPGTLFLHDLCVTEKNVGDGIQIPAETGVTILNSATNCPLVNGKYKCCYTGQTTQNCIDQNGYNTCRTVCDWESANAICHSLGTSCRMPEKSEFDTWTKDEAGNTLNICVLSSLALGEVQCYGRDSGGYCKGASGSMDCKPAILWGNAANSCMAFYGYKDRTWHDANSSVCRQNYQSTRCVCSPLNQSL